MPRVFFLFVSSSCKASTWQNNYLLMFNFHTLRLKLNNSNSIHGSVSWKWVSHRTTAGESSVWISSTLSLKFGKSLPFTVSLFLFLLPALPLVCHFWKAAMSLCTSAAQSTAVLQTHRDLEAHPKCNTEKSIVRLTGSHSAILSHACTVHYAMRNPVENHRTICRTGHYSEWMNVAEFLQLFTLSTPESLQETESSLTCTPPVWIHTGRVHTLHHKEPDHFCPHSTHKDAFIPHSPSIPTQNGTYWHQVNSLPTTESQCCTSSVCSKALGLYLTFMLDCMEPA